jgi:hypothetical protein
MLGYEVVLPSFPLIFRLGLEGLVRNLGRYCWWVFGFRFRAFVVNGRDKLAFLLRSNVRMYTLLLEMLKMSRHFTSDQLPLAECDQTTTQTTNSRP